MNTVYIYEPLLDGIPSAGITYLPIWLCIILHDNLMRTATEFVFVYVYIILVLIYGGGEGSTQKRSWLRYYACYKSEGSGFDSRCGYWLFNYIYLFKLHLLELKGSRRIWLTTSLSSVNPLSRKYWILDFPQASMASYRDSFTFFFINIREVSRSKR
jgi:hypothetical protein